MRLAIHAPVPTNVITGFLGAGKTTAILSLFRRRPVGERWAVLVNEFGEIGIDASLLGGADAGDGLFIREVPGGCMCCASGLPMQVALNRLLRDARPDRLLIEPTGLGHPREIIEALQQPEYASALTLQAVITLVDARKIADTRYTGHDIFRQQLEVADRIVANKRDLYEGDEVERLRAFLDSLGLEAVPLEAVTRGELDPAWLRPTRPRRRETVAACTAPGLLFDAAARDDAVELPPTGYLRRSGQHDGFHSVGWIFRRDLRFDPDRLHCLLASIDAERIKAVVVTDDAAIGYNMVDGVLTSLPLADADDSRIEIISAQALDRDALERELLDCLLPEPSESPS